MWKTTALCRVFCVGALGALALLLAEGAALAALETQGEEFVIRGLVFETEAGIVLAAEDETLYKLDGLDMEPYLESIVDVVGRIEENEHGEPVIRVSFVTLEEGAGQAPVHSSEDDPNKPVQ